MKYLLLLLLAGCATPVQPPLPTQPPIVVTPVTDPGFTVETDVQMCMQDPTSPWCVIECRQYAQVWCQYED